MPALGFLTRGWIQQLSGSINIPPESPSIVGATMIATPISTSSIGAPPPPSGVDAEEV